MLIKFLRWLGYWVDLIEAIANIFSGGAVGLRWSMAYVGWVAMKDWENRRKYES